jgi:hypothetical protein
MPAHADDVAQFLIHVCLAFNFDLHARIDQSLHLDQGRDR